MPKVKIGKFSFELPRNRIVRIGLGVALVLAGVFLWWLPLLGFWMAPLGLVVLASDSPMIRRFNRRAGVAIVGWWKGRKERRERIKARRESLKALGRGD